MYLPTLIIQRSFAYNFTNPGREFYHPYIRWMNLADSHPSFNSVYVSRFSTNVLRIQFLKYFENSPCVWSFVILSCSQTKQCMLDSGGTSSGPLLLSSTVTDSCQTSAVIFLTIPVILSHLFCHIQPKHRDYLPELAEDGDLSSSEDEESPQAMPQIDNGM